MNKAASRFVDAARWLAALLVVMHHSTNIFVNLADIMKASHGPLVYVWWFTTAFGFAHEGLVMFFVFSGVLVGGAVIERFKLPQPFFRKYLIDRTIRIYIVLIPVLIIGAALDLSGRWLFAGHNIYESAAYLDHFDPMLLAASMANLQGIWFSAFGTNEPLWSLGVEFWYYIVFPLLFLPLSVWYSKPGKILGCCAGMAIFAALAVSGSYFAYGFVPWLIGVAVRRAPRPLVRSKYAALAIWIIPSIALRLKFPFPFSAVPRQGLLDVVTALLIANLLLTLRFDEGEGFRFCSLKLHKFMADFSYSLYAVHLPILVIIWGITDVVVRPGWHAELATPAHYAVAAGSAIFILFVAYLLSRVTEARTDEVRKLAYRLIPERSEAAAVSEKAA